MIASLKFIATASLSLFLAAGAAAAASAVTTAAPTRPAQVETTKAPATKLVKVGHRHHVAHLRHLHKKHIATRLHHRGGAVMSKSASSTSAPMSQRHAMNRATSTKSPAVPR